MTTMDTRRRRDVANAEVLAALEGRMTELVAALHGTVINHVLASETAQLDSTGVLERNYTVPFGSVWIDNCQGAGLVTVVGGIRGGSAPTVGKGVHVVRAGEAKLVPLTGRVLTLWGAPGGLISLAVFTRLLPVTNSIGGATPGGVGGDGTIVAVNGQTTQIVAADSSRQSITIANPTGAGLRITYDSTGAAAGFAVAAGGALTLNTKRAVYVKNATGGNLSIDFITD